MPNIPKVTRLKMSDGVIYTIYDETALHEVSIITSKDQMYVKSSDGEQVMKDMPVSNSVGKDSVINTTTNDNISRANIANGAYSVAFGSRNVIGADASESGAFGGDVHINSENTYGFGYHVWAHSNQNLIGGYDVGSNAKESFIFGNTIGVDCTHNNSTHEWTANSTADVNKSRYLAIFGKNHIIASNCQSDLVYGIDNNIPQYVYRSAIGGNGNRIQGALDNSFVFGQEHYLGSNSSNWINVFGYNNKIGLADPTGNSDSYSGGNEDVNVFGYQNRVGACLTDSTVIGYYNKIAGGSSTSSKNESVYAIGYSNTNKPSSTAYQRTFMIGAYLRAESDDRVIVGRYNDGTGINGTFFEVGCGSSDAARRTGFAVGYENSEYFAYLGPTRLVGSSGGLKVNGTTVSLSGHAHNNATSNNSGFMSAEDKKKLDDTIILQNNEYYLTDGTRSVSIADVITHITTCFRGDTSYVTMYDGTTRLISEVKAGDSVLGYDVNKQEYCEAIVLDNIKTGESNEFDCYVFEDGTTVDIYGNDSFLTHHMSNFDNPEAANSDCFSACWIDYLYSRSREHKDYIRKVIKNTGGKDNGVAVVYKRTFKCAASTGRYCIDTSNGTCFINGLCQARKPVNMITRLMKYHETFGSKIDSIFAGIIARHSGGIDDLIPDDHIEDVASVELFKEWNSNKASITIKKEFLNNTDYKAMKYAEGVLSEEEWLPIKEQRIAARAEINRMEERNAEIIPLLKETNPYFMHEYGDKYAWVYRNREEMLDFADLNNMLEDVREHFNS